MRKTVHVPMMYWFLAKILLPLVRLRIHVEGVEHLPKDRPFLVAANHVDYLDGFFLTAAIVGACHRRVRFLSETNNYWWTNGATIQVDPLDKARSVSRARSAYDAGDVVCFFVEGRRNFNAILLPPKTGIARLAAATGAVMVPIGIVGTGGTSFPNSVRRALLGRERFTLRIGPPLTLPPVLTQDSTDSDLHREMDRVMAALAPLAQKPYSPPST